MRLTLRTLLAYMDDILDPADHEDLGKKIESSDFATELIHRSRDTVRRLRLGAPAVLATDGEDVLGAEMTADANTVAEYLDNTLSPESVAEFERICLEPGVNADVHLAEVASCHHVLTMVLGEPAEIAAEIRERMYALPDELASGKLLRIEPAHQADQQAPPPQPSAPAVSSPVERVERATEVPDYLRAASKARRSRIRWIAAAVILFMTSIVGYVVWAPVPEPVLPSGLAAGVMDSLKEGLTIGEVEIESPSVSIEPAPDGDSQAPPFDPGGASQETAEPPVAADELDDAPAFESPSPLPVTEGDEPDADEAEARIVDEAPLPEMPEPEPPLAAADSETDAEDETAVGEDPDEALTDLAEVPPLPVAEGPVQIGNYLGSSGDVLLRRDSTNEKWIRLPPRTAISTGDRLLTLPKFRTHVSLADGNVYLSGGTQLAFPEPDVFGEEAHFTLDIVYGRLLFNAGLNGTRMTLKVDDQFRQVELSGSASLAVEVRRVFVPGSNFEHETAPIEVFWYLTSGSIEWPGPAGGMQTITAPSAWKTVDSVDELPQPIDQLPQWIDREGITDMERRARNTLAEELKPGESVGLTLLELNDPRGGGRRREVRTLAAESNLYVGEFEPFVKALSDTDQIRYWVSHIDSLREAMALSPVVASRVREAFENLRGQQAADVLMEMVRGYNRQEIGETREELQQGAIVKLLGWLDSDSLDYRVLAIYNLNKITGTSYLEDYRPELDSTRRKRALRKLWDRFETNELLPAGSWQASEQ
ncbi:MAG: hypothetical protein IH898_02095 [Planctomycetes bacterium]|nr:hypothetical protein [Planctomycetota bacterium]